MSFIHATTIANRLTALQLLQECITIVDAQDASFQDASNEVNMYFMMVDTTPASISIDISRVASALTTFITLYETLGYTVNNDGNAITISVQP